MNLRIAKIEDLPSGELVLATRTPNPNDADRWAIVVGTDKDEKFRYPEDEYGLLFFSSREDEIENVIMAYHVPVLATGAKVKILVDKTSISQFRQQLPASESTESKLCVLASGAYLFVQEKTSRPTHFDRSFFISVDGKATPYDEMENRDKVARVTSWKWIPSNEAAVVLEDIHEPS